MKKCRLVAVVVLVVCVPGMSFDQDMIEKGVIGGINYASFGGADAGGGDRYPKRLLRYTAGGFAAFKLNQNILIRPEVHYSMKGAKYEESEDPKGLDAEIRINYLDIPVLFVFAPQPQLQVYTGPMLGVYLSGEYYFKYARYGNEWEDIETKGHITNPDFGAVVGVGYGFTDKISMHVRYSMGLISWDDEGDLDVKHNGLQILLGTTL